MERLKRNITLSRTGHSDKRDENFIIENIEIVKSNGKVFAGRIVNKRTLLHVCSPSHCHRRFKLVWVKILSVACENTK